MSSIRPGRDDNILQRMLLCRYATENKAILRQRITELNTKAYYMLATLGFLYSRGTGSDSLKLSISLTAISAVTPVVDFVKTTNGLEILRAFKLICITLALVFMIRWIWTS